MTSSPSNVWRSSMAGNTAQYSSQYRQALQMVSCRWASVVRSAESMGGCFLSGDPPEDGRDRESESGQVALGQDVSGHQLARGEQVRAGLAVVADDAGLLGDLHPEIGERDAGPQRIGPVRRGGHGAGPGWLLGVAGPGGQAVQPRRVERP